MGGNSTLSTKYKRVTTELNARKRRAANLKDFHVWYISLVGNTVNNIIPKLNSITKYMDKGSVQLGNFDYKNLSKEPIICKDGMTTLSEYEEWKFAFRAIKKRYSKDGIDILSK